MRQDPMSTRTKKNTQGSLNIKERDMTSYTKSLIEKSKNDAITIAKWAKSCETKEQFDNVARFAHRHKFVHNRLSESEVSYWVGTLDGILVVIEKIKFKNLVNNLHSK